MAILKSGYFDIMLGQFFVVLAILALSMSNALIIGNNRHFTVKTGEFLVIAMLTWHKHFFAVIMYSIHLTILIYTFLI